MRAAAHASQCLRSSSACSGHQDHFPCPPWPQPAAGVPQRCKSYGLLHHPRSTSPGQVSISPKPAASPEGSSAACPVGLREARPCLSYVPADTQRFELFPGPRPCQSQDLLSSRSSTSSWCSSETGAPSSVPVPAYLQKLASDGQG